MPQEIQGTVCSPDDVQPGVPYPDREHAGEEYAGGCQAVVPGVLPGLSHHQAQPVVLRRELPVATPRAQAADTAGQPDRAGAVQVVREGPATAIGARGEPPTDVFGPMPYGGVAG